MTLAGGGVARVLRALITVVTIGISLAAAARRHIKALVLAAARALQRTNVAVCARIKVVARRANRFALATRTELRRTVAFGRHFAAVWTRVGARRAFWQQHAVRTTLFRRVARVRRQTVR